MKRVKLGLIGCGIIAQDHHYPALKRLESRFEIVLLCNRTLKKARHLQRKYKKGEIAQTYKDVLRNSDIDAVIIALPIPFSAKVSIEALHAGKHVLCEKPIAAHPIEARKVVSAAQKSKGVYMVAENFAYDPHFLKALDIIKRKKLGRIYYAEDTVFWKYNDRNKYTKTKWRKNPAYLGGFFLDGGVHFINQPLSFLGKAQRVVGTAYNSDIQNSHDNALAMTFSMKNRSLLQLNFVMSPVARLDRRLVLYGTKANLEILPNDLYLIKPGKKRKRIFVKGPDGFEKEFIAFYDAIVKKKKPFMDARRGYSDLITLHAGLRAVKSGKKVYIED
jgi:predicted dehydrogenase